MCRHLMIGVLCVFSVVASLGCADDDDEHCDPVANRGCGGEEVCEEVIDGDPICVPPLVVRGEVIDLSSGEPVSGARVVGLDVNRAAVSAVAISDELGLYALRVPALRRGDGSVVGTDIFLRVDAAGYQSFPGPIRRALPLATDSAEREDGELVLRSSLTTVGLVALAAGAGRATIHGVVEAPASRVGTLVVAERSGGGVAATAIADSDGDYAIFNLAGGSYQVTAYARGVGFETVGTSLASDGDDARVDLAIEDGVPTSTVTGSINFVNAPVGTGTSVILVVESTFDPVHIRGEAPPGLRVEVPKGSPEFEIDGVPAGDYVALAGFENDLMVRDPDVTQGGTAIVHTSVGAGERTELGASFKVTDALATFGPGADFPEEVTGAPVLRFEDDAGEDHFTLQVFDAFGTEVWSTRVDKHTSTDPEVPYAGPPLTAGMFYQFRAVSRDRDGVPLSSTEDLRGVFFLR